MANKLNIPAPAGNKANGDAIHGVPRLRTPKVQIAGDVGRVTLTSGQGYPRKT